ncbi:MAG: FHA domain-containing protein [Pseudomonadota bacterium]
MTLRLQALDGSGAERIVAVDRPFTLGRGPDNDWVLADPEREVSKVHCRIENDGTDFILIDQSINGLTIEGNRSPTMGPGRRHKLADGDIFAVGRHRFKVSATDRPDLAGSEGVPAGVHRILGGSSEGVEARATGAVVGDAERWLGSLPTGAAEQVMHQPMGWAEPPSTQQSLLPPDFDHPVSDFANRSEHLAGINSAMPVPQAQQILPTDWLAADDRGASPAASPRTVVPLHSGEKPRLRRQDQFEPNEARQILAEGARLGAAAFEDTPSDTLFRRCGETLRALLDGLDSLEAAQAVAERDCGVSAPTQISAQPDFFSSSRDPIPALLSASEAGPAQHLAQRFVGLANRQRALGRALAQAVDAYEAELMPAAVEKPAGGRFRFGPFRQAKAWKMFVQRHAALSAEQDGPNGLRTILRKAFADALVRDS